MFITLDDSLSVVARSSLFVIASEARQSLSATEIASSPLAPRNDTGDCLPCSEL